MLKLQLSFIGEYAVALRNGPRRGYGDKLQERLARDSEHAGPI